jgi:hypothetical protein
MKSMIVHRFNHYNTYYRLYINKKTICHYASPTMEDLHSSSLQLPSFDPWAIFTNKKETTPFHFCATTAVVSPPS